MIDKKSWSISPKKFPKTKTINCLNTVDYETEELTGEVINIPHDTDPPPRDQSAGFWRLKVKKNASQRMDFAALQIIKKF